METRELMVPSSEVTARIVAAVPAGALEAPTPCPDWDVRALINHMIFWSGRGECAARKEPPPPGPEEGHDFTGDGDWGALHAEQARRTAEAWTSADAWTGTASLTGPADGGMPAPFLGNLLLTEGIVHGWDLALATGQTADFPEDALRAAHEHLQRTAAMGRDYGAFGAEAAVPDDAPLLDRIVALTGRDPAWKP